MGTEVINGAARYYGPRLTEKKFASNPRTAGEVRELSCVFNYDSLPTNSTNNSQVISIPAYSFILSAHLVVLTAFAGGTSYAVGLVQADGTAIDADGLITDANAPLTNINLAGEWVTGSGAMVAPANGATNVAATGPISTVAGQLKVTATGTFTAGKGRIVVRYMEQE